MSMIAEHSDGERHDSPWASRRFIPAEHYGNNVDPRSIECFGRHWTYLACEQQSLCQHQALVCDCCGPVPEHCNAIVIAVDGACRNNGYANATSSIGVFVGDNSRYNISARLNLSRGRPTNQVAELEAGIAGLCQALEIQNDGVDGYNLSQVVIKSDSMYLVQGMTENIFTWVWGPQGYKTSQGVSIRNSPLFRNLHLKVKELNSYGVGVSFWHVPRNSNEDADRLANQALGNHGSSRRQ